MINNIKIIFRYLKFINAKYLVLMIFGSILVGLTTIIFYFYPMVFKSIIDNAINYKKIFKEDILYLLFLFIFSIIFEYIGGIIFVKNMVNSQMDVRVKLFEQSYLINYLDIKNKGSTYYARLINEDVSDSFQIFYNNYFINSLFSLIRFIPVLITIFIWDKIIFALFCSIIFLFFLYSFLENKITRQNYEILFDKYGKVLQFINETLDKILTIQVFNFGPKRTEKFIEIGNEVNYFNKKIEIMKSSLRAFFINTPIFLARILIILYSIYEYIKGKMSIGTITAIFTYFSFIEGPLHNLKYLSEVIIGSSVLAERILKFFDYCQSFITVTRDLKYKVKSDKIYSVFKLKKIFNNKIILDEISFDIENNQITAIVGLSGEGKSTLINCLMGFDKDHSGMIVFNKVNLNDISLNDLLKEIQYYPQKNEIFNLDLKENIILGSEYNDELYENILQELEIEYLKDRKLIENGTNISGGEITKISFARFLYNINDKNFLILDEPFVSIDIILKRRYLEILKKSIKNKSGIIISHDFDIILTIANNILVLNEGKIVESGSIESLLNNKEGLFRKMYDLYMYNFDNSNQ